MTGFLYWLSVIASLAFFLCASYTDLRSRTVPIEWSAIPYAVILLYLVFSFMVVSVLARILSALAVFGVLCVCAKFLGGGGGDAVVIPMIALLYGLAASLLTLLAACLIMMIYIGVRALATRKKPDVHEDFPMMPCVTAAYCVLILTV